MSQVLFILLHVIAGVFSCRQLVHEKGSAAVGLHNSPEVVNGNPAIAYYEYGSVKDLRYVRARDVDGDAWFDPILVDAFGDAGADADLEIVNGRPAIAYVGDSKVKFVRSNDANGDAWGVPVIVEASTSGLVFSAMIVANGRPAIVYVHGSFGSTNLYYKRASDANGSAWPGSPVTVENSGSVGSGTPGFSIINGNPAVAYHEGLYMYYRHGNNADGSSFASKKQASTTVLDSYTDTELIEVNGLPYIVCEAVGEKIVAFRSNSATGATWPNQDVVIVSGPSDSDDFDVKMVGARLAVAFYQHTGFDLMYTRATNAAATTWGAPVAIDVQSSGIIGRYAELFIVNGRPAATYWRYSDGDLWFARSDDITGSIWSSALCGPTPAPTPPPTPPTPAPTMEPTSAPTKHPTVNPTTAPTKYPTVNPTAAPSKYPTEQPTKEPTVNPSPAPTLPPGAPTTAPTPPTPQPTQQPTKEPTNQPTKQPAPPPGAPTIAPTPPTPHPTTPPTPVPVESGATSSSGSTSSMWTTSTSASVDNGDDEPSSGEASCIDCESSVGVLSDSGVLVGIIVSAVCCCVLCVLALLFVFRAQHVKKRRAPLHRRQSGTSMRHHRHSERHSRSRPSSNEYVPFALSNDDLSTVDSSQYARAAHRAVDTSSVGGDSTMYINVPTMSTTLPNQNEGNYGSVEAAANTGSYASTYGLMHTKQEDYTNLYLKPEIYDDGLSEI